jgi:hypothetical protein
VKSASSVKRPEEIQSSAPADLFSLPAPSFVEAFAKALGLSDDELTEHDRDTLVSAIRSGTSRFKVIDALQNRRQIPQAFERGQSHAIRRPPTCFALLENLTRFAPDDDAAFLRYAFAQLCDREPSHRESIEFEFDLRRGQIDRTAVVRRVAAIARREGRSALWDTLQPDVPDTQSAADPTFARNLPSGLVYDEGGRETLVFVQKRAQGGWSIGPDVLRQPFTVVDDGWSVRDGWLIVGPKRTLAAGVWRVDIDVVQASEAIFDVDVVANSGLDVLQRLTICGSFSGGFCVEFRPEHMFCEFRLSIREQVSNAAYWLKPRKISMQRIS